MIHFTLSRYGGSLLLMRSLQVFILLWVLFAQSLLAKTYYVDPGRGNDAGLGAFGTPWRTIAKANVTLRAGDTVF